MDMMSEVDHKCRLPPWNMSLPIEGLHEYERALHEYDGLVQELARRRGLNTSRSLHRYLVKSPITFRCNESARATDLDTQIQEASCHSILFHGKLSHRCLAKRNIKMESLPCVGSLLITGTGASGTDYTAKRLNTAGYNSIQNFIMSNRTSSSLG